MNATLELESNTVTCIVVIAGSTAGFGQGLARTDFARIAAHNLGLAWMIRQSEFVQNLVRVVMSCGGALLCRCENVGWLRDAGRRGVGAAAFRTMVVA